MKRLQTNKLYCFSPPVMIATFVIEIGFALYTLYRYRLDKAAQLVMLILVFLAIFQLAEYNVCEGAFGVDSLTWARIGYVAITFLPVFGLHLMQVIAKRINGAILTVAYAVALFFAGFYLTAGHGLTSSVCLGNYVIFNVDPHMNNFYALYYYGFEMIAMIFAWYYARLQTNTDIKKALYGLAIGYACLFIPTTTVNIIDPSTLRGIPSIMCGFAVLLAIIVTWYVLPRVGTKK